MTPKQRISAVLNRQPVDRLPVDIWHTDEIRKLLADHYRAVDDLDLYRRMGIEGYDESRWILLDYGDLVVHLFDAQTREYYALEDLWGRAKRVPFPSHAPTAS